MNLKVMEEVVHFFKRLDYPAHSRIENFLQHDLGGISSEP
jgi:hypothetical protein